MRVGGGRFVGPAVAEFKAQSGLGLYAADMRNRTTHRGQPGFQRFASRFRHAKAKLIVIPGGDGKAPRRLVGDAVSQSRGERQPV